jgi:hypothetical protein
VRDDTHKDSATEVRLTGSLGRRLLAHGETYLRRKRHLARCVQVYRAERTESRARAVEEATASLKRAEEKLARSLWRLRQEIEHEVKERAS